MMGFDFQLVQPQAFIKSIIRTRRFNEYPTVVQRLPGCLTITTEQNATILAKNTNPAAELLCSGVRLCAETVEKPCFKRFSGIEKVHRNSIKITVDFWRRRWDLNPCAGYPTYSLSRGAPSPLGYFSMVNIKEKCGGEEEIRTLGPLRDH